MIPFIDASDLVPFGSVMPYESDSVVIDPPASRAGDAESQWVTWDDAREESEWAAAELSALTAIH